LLSDDEDYINGIVGRDRLLKVLERLAKTAKDDFKHNKEKKILLQNSKQFKSNRMLQLNRRRKKLQNPS
jgi:hypothetical protein